MLEKAPANLRRLHFSVMCVGRTHSRSGFVAAVDTRTVEPGFALARLEKVLVKVAGVAWMAEGAGVVEVEEAEDAAEAEAVAASSFSAAKISTCSSGWM